MLKRHLILFTTSLLLAAPLHATEPSGLEIMQQVDSRGDDLIQKMTQRLVDKRGSVREREMISFRKDEGKDKKSITYFLAPSNVRDTALLTWDYDGVAKDDDQWLYLPALKKVRRIASADRGDYFMGTDFTFEDIKQTPELEDYHWKNLGSDQLEGQDVWIIEAEPKSDDLKKSLGYSKIQYYVRKDIHMFIRTDFWDRKGQPLKQLISSGIRQIQGIWTATSGTMHNLQSGHRTELIFSDQRYNSGLSDRQFTERMLKRGYREE